MKNVYISIPKQEALDIFKNRLTICNKLRTNDIHETIQLINVVKNQNYF